ncbi:hypothetical protein Gohar_015277 [Gossypium harknessii]|uniref:NADPH-dependent FMN and FAD-containing oxidoreductase n=1 Tax=Gossypium harknessii TaxID=34285 RepID=A0A7J9FZR1_9ROSI|nr:hypothetical protein [Gossypium harknessii]
MEMKSKTLLILYATQTGNALDVAERIAREAERRACTVVIRSTDDYDANSLPAEDTVIFVVSTTGQGDTPDSMKARLTLFFSSNILFLFLVFWRFLLQRNLGSHWLERIHYAVFGLGDSGYQKYNFVAKKLDKRLSDLGATAVVERGLGDDQHPSGYEAALDPWLSSLWIRLNEIKPHFFPKGPDFLVSNEELIGLPKVQVTYHNVDDMDSRLSTATDFKYLQMQIGRARSMSSGKVPHEKSKPDAFLKMVKNFPLTRASHEKDVRHFEFEFVSQVIKYEIGDVLEVLPSQSPAAVDSFIQRCNLDPESLITVMSFFATAEHEKERLQYFASPEGRDDLYQYNQKERRTVLEVLEDFPSVQMPFEWFVQLVPPLKNRAFSISSSPLAHPTQVHLTVDVVSWTTPFKRKRQGLCSTWLASLDPEQSIYIPVWFHKGLLPPPPPSLPLIVIGPGTGCAPFRGFVEERAVQSQSSTIAPTLLFFGCRNENNDFLYRDFWLSHSENDGVLSEAKGGGFYAAFSRDQPQKVYVQHKMQEQSERIWNLLCEGAAIYVAGSSTKMPSDVMVAFEEIISKESGAPRESAVRWLRSLEKAGKYHVEAWS